MTSTSSKTRRILVVDDNIVGRQLICNFLRSPDHEIVEVQSGEDAIARLGETGATYDLIILDVDMPGLSGLEVARRIRSEPGTREIPIIFSSAMGDRETILAAARLGCAGFLVKPIKRQVLLGRIAEALERIETPEPGADSGDQVGEEVT